MEVQVSLPLAFGAGVVSFLSACVLPVVPGYVGFVAALTLRERAEASARRARVAVLAHSALFLAGFGAVFLSLGLVPTRIGPPIAWTLPWLQRAGGLFVALYGAYLIVGFRAAVPRGGFAVRAGAAAATGIAFGAGWTPCIGPVLGSILLYVTLEGTMVRGFLLLLVYGVGLSLPFLLTSLGLNLPLAGSKGLEAWRETLGRVAGGILLALGLALMSGWFARITASLAGLGQLINLEL